MSLIKLLSKVPQLPTLNGRVTLPGVLVANIEVPPHFVSTTDAQSYGVRYVFNSDYSLLLWADGSRMVW